MKNLPIVLARNWQHADAYRVSTLLNQISEAINLEVLPEVVGWEQFSARIKQIADESEDVVISEIGSTWLGHFIANQNLTRFSKDDMMTITGEDKWSSTIPLHLSNSYSIPWLSDSPVLYYWRDIVDESGVDPALEFSSVHGFEHALNKISQTTLQYPWAMSTTRSPASLHQLASWLWGNNCDIVDESGQNIHILEIKSIQAVTHYFSLSRFIPEFSRTSHTRMIEYFTERQAAIIMGGTYTYRELKRILPPFHLERIGVVLPPGVPFVGSENLVMWKHVRDEQKQQGLDFLQQMFLPEIHQSFADVAGLFPVNKDLLNTSHYQDNRFLWTIATAIQTGRAYPVLPQWTQVEEHLLDTIDAIWEDVFANRLSDVENIVFKHLIRLGQNIRPLLHH